MQCICHRYCHACHGFLYSLSLFPSYPLSHPPSLPLTLWPTLLPPFPSFQVIFHAEQEKFTIDDGFQQPITLSSPSRELLGATFYKFVLKNIGMRLHGTSIRILVTVQSSTDLCLPQDDARLDSGSSRHPVFGRLHYAKLDGGKAWEQG